MQSTMAAALAASAMSFAPAAHADRVGFSVAVGGPGYAVAFGNAPSWGAPAWPAYGYRPQLLRPKWRPVYAPPPAGYVVSGYAPPAVYGPPVAGYAVATYAPVVVYAPRVVHAPPVNYRGRYAHRPGVERYRDQRVDHDRD